MYAKYRLVGKERKSHTVLLYESVYAGLLPRNKNQRSLFSETYTETVGHKEPLKIWIRKFFERSQVTYRFAEAESCIDRNRIVKQYISYENAFVQL